MSDDITLKRVERLLNDLEYEFVRGIAQGYIKEQLEARVYLPGRDGKVWRFYFCLHEDPHFMFREPNTYGLKLVKGGKDK